MYAYIRGKLVKNSPALAIVEANGIGYEIKISLQTYSALREGEAIKLHTYLYIKEDIQALYGFFEEEEKTLFLHLISVSGIGPSTGLMFLFSLSAKEIKQAIANGDLKTIQSVKGVGGKTAQRVVLELKDKLGKELLEEGETVEAAYATTSQMEEALTALLVMGIPKPAAEKALTAITKKFGNNLSVEELIKLALKGR